MSPSSNGLTDTQCSRAHAAQNHAPPPSPLNRAAGDSAGGNLALSALAKLRDAGALPAPPAGLLLVSPCVDMGDGCVFTRDDAEARAAGEHDYLPRDKLAGALPHLYADVSGGGLVVWGPGRAHAGYLVGKSPL